MSVFHENMLIGSSGQGAPAAAGISRSLRFNSSDSAYLSRTPASAGNRKTWTWSGWAKRSSTVNSKLFYTQTGSAQGGIQWESTAQISYFNYAGNYSIVKTTGVFRDFSAWYHIVVTLDAANTSLKIYVNGVEQALTVSAAIVNENHTINSTVEHNIGKEPTASEYFNGYLAEIHFIDGQALTPSSFAETDATTGQWIPKLYSGSYGTNGFKLNFSDNSAATATTLGKDTANSNNWTPNNFSVTAGAGNDSLVDTPTSYGTDDGLGGSVRGNYATWNPLIRTTATYTNGNLDVSLNSSTSSANPAVGTIFFNSGKWYWEVACISADFGVAAYRVGITTPGAQNSGLGNSASSWCFLGNGQVFNGGTATNYGTSIANGDILNIALDVDAGRIWYGRNGTWFASGNPATNTSPSQTFTAGLTLAPAVASGANTTAYVLNAGARSFAYTAPSGFKALCDTNLTAPVVAKPNTAMDVALYTGTGSALTATSALGFSPDFVWIKGRSGATDHALYDAVRGATLDLVSNSTAAETTQTQGLTAFNSNGFSVGTLAKVNTSSATYAAWCWDAGSSSASPNNDGTVTSTVKVNATAGFSIVTWTYGNAPTVGHGLGAAPSLIIAKSRTVAVDWVVYHRSLGKDKLLVLNDTGAEISSSNYWGSSEPSSTVFGTIGNNTNSNNRGDMVAYCFAPVVGYSSFGSYTGNGSTDGPFVYTGFRPRWVMIKASSSTGDWYIIDTSRDTHNLSGKSLQANTSNAEPSVGGSFSMTDDILSNGFKLRDGGSGSNGSSVTYVYAAFAENPFQYARAR